MGSSYWRLLPRGSDFLRRIVLGRLLAAMAQREGAAIVHVNLLWPKPFWFLSWPKMLGLPTVGHARSYYGRKPLPPRTIQKVCDALICVSRLVYEDAAQICQHPRRYPIYDPIDVDRYEKGNAQRARQTLALDPNCRVVSSVGLLSPHKGHDVAITAFTQVSRSVEDVVLYVAGGGNPAERQRLQQLAADCGISGKVIFSGEQLRNIEDVYAMSEFVYSLTTCGEAFGRVPLEAGAAGKPVIVTSLGAAPELVIDGQTGYLVDPKDVEKVVGLSIKLLRDRSLSEQMGMCARQHVQANFSPRRHAAAVEDVYRDVLAARTPTRAIHD